MCTKIQDFACKIPKFFRGYTPGPPPAPTPRMAVPCAGALCALGSADPDPHSYFNTPQIQNPV
jgi:hypothetical protein